jgi:hypothetical protein
MPYLLKSAALYLKKNAANGADAMYIRNLWTFMFPTFVESIAEEVDVEVLASSLGSFAQVRPLLAQS